MATAVAVGATNNQDIDGLLSGYAWTGIITYSFPDSTTDYPDYSAGNDELTSGFSQAPSQMQAAINYAIGLIAAYTTANIQYAGNGSADIMVAQSSAANPTSYAYYPANVAPGGDVWFGTAYNYSLAALGNYYFTTALHELGHAFGLKHSQDEDGVSNVALPTAHDDSEYTVMSYRSYAGGPLTGYTNESYGYSQTYMANDILAFQTLYGANYATHSENTIYTWSPTTGQEFINGVGQLAPGGGAGGSADRIYETVWDGGGVDTYDLSNYTTNLSINLNPGAASLFSTAQLANLGDGHYAAGNVYNAYEFNNNAASLIDNATGGSGNDIIVGNAIANVLNGGSGNDMITGGGGNDTIIGGAGTDTAVYSGSKANYAISYNANTQILTLIDQRAASPDGTDIVSGVENFQFSDGTVALASLIVTPQADLSEYVAVNQTSVAANGSLIVDAYNMNLGDAVAGASTAGIYLSTDSTITGADTLLATVVTSGTLATVSQPGYYDHKTFMVVLPGGLAPGTYYIGGIADYNCQLTERSETNNTYNVVQVTVTGQGLPDLSEYVSVQNTTVAAGGNLSIDAYNMNLGNGVAAPSVSGLYLSTDATITSADTLIGTLTTSTTLATISQPGYYDHQTTSIALPGNLAPGTYYVGGISDYNNQLSESNQVNHTYNVVQVTVAPPPQPDLSEYVAVDKTIAAAGDSVTVDAYNMNLGNAVAGSTTAGIYISTDATISGSDTLLATLTTTTTLATVSQPGYYDHQTVTLTLPGGLQPGTYYIGGVSDYNHQFTESNETNNTYNVVQLTVTPPRQADLSEYVEVNKTAAVAGTSLTIDAYNMNLGNAVAGASTAGIYLSTDATITTSDSLLATLTTSTTLATVSQPGYYDHQTVTVTLPGNLAPGTYYVGGIANYNHQLSESSTSNNTYNVVQVTVSAPAAPAHASAASSFGQSGMKDNFALSQPGDWHAGSADATDHAHDLQNGSAWEFAHMTGTVAEADGTYVDVGALAHHAGYHDGDYHLI